MPVETLSSCLMLMRPGRDARLCRECREQAIFSIWRELASHTRQKKTQKFRFLNSFGKNCCFNVAASTWKAESSGRHERKCPQSLSMFRQTSPAYLAHKEPLLELGVSGETTVNAIHSTSQLCGPRLFTTRQKEVFSLDLGDLRILERVDSINTVAVYCKASCLDRLVLGSSWLLCTIQCHADCFDRAEEDKALKREVYMYRLKGSRDAATELWVFI